MVRLLYRCFLGLLVMLTGENIGFCELLYVSVICRSLMAPRHGLSYWPTGGFVFGTFESILYLSIDRRTFAVSLAYSASSSSCFLTLTFGQYSSLTFLLYS